MEKVIKSLHTLRGGEHASVSIQPHNTSTLFDRFVEAFPTVTRDCLNGLDHCCVKIPGPCEATELPSFQIAMAHNDFSLAPNPCQVSLKRPMMYNVWPEKDKVVVYFVLPKNALNVPIQTN